MPTETNREVEVHTAFRGPLGDSPRLYAGNQMSEKARTLMDL